MRWHSMGWPTVAVSHIIMALIPYTCMQTAQKHKSGSAIIYFDFQVKLSHNC